MIPSDIDPVKMRVMLAPEALAKPKPPLGLIPRHMFEQATKHERIADIKRAIIRYLEAGKRLSPKWIEEYNELTASITQ
jgi:hypothetical protein